MRLLFLGKKDDFHCARALSFARKNLEVEAHLGGWGDPFPDDALQWQGDYVVSYLSRWIVPETIIRDAKVAAINFHPASPDYPGIGCNNFALYEGASTYGATCHFMDATVDTGSIIETVNFPVYESDDVASLLARTYDFQLSLFYRVMARIIAGERLEPNGASWTRPAFTRRQFNALSRIDASMPAEEIKRRVRATNYGSWKPSIEIAGLEFTLK